MLRNGFSRKTRFHSAPKGHFLQIFFRMETCVETVQSSNFRKRYFSPEKFLGFLISQHGFDYDDPRLFWAYTAPDIGKSGTRRRAVKTNRSARPPSVYTVCQVNNHLLFLFLILIFIKQLNSVYIKIWISPRDGFRRAGGLANNYR